MEELTGPDHDSTDQDLPNKVARVVSCARLALHSVYDVQLTSPTSASPLRRGHLDCVNRCDGSSKPYAHAENNSSTNKPGPILRGGRHGSGKNDSNGIAEQTEFPAFPIADGTSDCGRDDVADVVGDEHETRRLAGLRVTKEIEVLVHYGIVGEIHTNELAGRTGIDVGHDAAIESILNGRHERYQETSIEFE